MKDEEKKTLRFTALDEGTGGNWRTGENAGKQSERVWITVDNGNGNGRGYEKN